MTRNRWVQGASAALLAAVLLLLVRGCEREHRTTEDALQVGGALPVSRNLADELGVEGDTERDTVQTLVAEVKNLREQADRLRDDNVALRKDNDQLRKMEARLGQDLASDLQQARQSVQTRFDRDMAQAQQRLNQLEARAQALQRDLPRESNPKTGPAAGYDPQAITWVAPLGERFDVGSTFAAHLNRVTGQGVAEADDTRRAGLTGNRLVPYYTVPRNATLMNATAMTALVGRVPIGSQVTDPYSFKVIIGTDNLAANGIELPEVAYAVASGQAVGDWTLGCVRGTLRSITFVFSDGTIRTVPKAADVYDGSARQQGTVIGELSDAYGNPCVPGERISNATSYLSQRIGVVSATAAAEAAAASQTTQVTSIGGGGAGVGTIVTGDTGQYILGQAVADGSAEIARWLDERQAQQFDAVYVDPGRTVSLHITEQLDIDYDPDGRRVNHRTDRQGGYRALD